MIKMPLICTECGGQTEDGRLEIIYFICDSCLIEID